MTRISLELVPRNQIQLEEELAAVARHFPQLHTVNIPDLMRFPVRSWEGCATAKQYVPHAIPHIRAIDFSRTAPFPLLDTLRQHGLHEILVVTGDPPPADETREDGATAVELIRLIKQADPNITIYAAIDPYRNGIQQELEYARAKQEAGADGFFTQPFFDVRLMEIFYEQLPDLNIYWGVSPVLAEGSKKYWISRNRAVFPSHFQPTLEWNWNFGRDALRFAQATGGNIYFMPIRANVVEYLSGILVDEREAVLA
ncbi:MAG: methylenetetrahydrofolate reductase [Chloroflexi bacterium]|nr:methylenetetrahydrofolate reductase [Chloroflexota bacterium]